MNTEKQTIITGATEAGSPFWKRIAEELGKPGRRQRVVNVARLARVTKPGEVVVVPGKVLGDGVLGHKITVAAYSFSGQALSKLEAAGCTVLSLEDFLKKNPKGKGRIIG